MSASQIVRLVHELRLENGTRVTFDPPLVIQDEGQMQFDIKIESPNALPCHFHQTWNGPQDKDEQPASWISPETLAAAAPPRTGDHYVDSTNLPEDEVPF